MSFVEGQSLDKTWESYDEDTKAHVANQLKEYLRELQQFSNGNYIGSVDSDPVTDPILESYHVNGPFDSEEAYQSKAPKRQIKNFLSDLRLQNIMTNDGSVNGVLDWEFSRWYPEYWEFSKALYVWKVAE
ncbi:hypothetical protein N7471_003427 [Penicillium samsonianum]|uniref:uncharacterized protein n=1 Tax=Penicillium samsonianum TaxID=1882272 RepID=UPI002547E480|nr:uncharacterized protein N7471_003427 [Penicillium samsonianum]KAJ6143974.1 hypothetical protein N7471_003427 [Penicillium samsonianum]